MTEEIYLNFESDPAEYVSQVVNVKVNLPNVEDKRQIKNSGQNSCKSSCSNNIQKENRVGENPNKENRQKKTNNTLKDLIKILILNQLLGGNMRPQNSRIYNSSVPRGYIRPQFPYMT